MKKILRLLIVIIVAVLVFVGYTKIKRENNSIDWEQMIRNELLSGSSNVEKEIAKVVRFNIKEEKKYLFITVNAPDICNDLIIWIEQISEEDFTTENLEAEILQLLQSTEPMEYKFELDYIEAEEEVQIRYTQEFIEALTCGLTRFGGELTNRIAEEMEDAW